MTFIQLFFDATLHIIPVAKEVTIMYGNLLYEIDVLREIDTFGKCVHSR